MRIKQNDQSSYVNKFLKNKDEGRCFITVTYQIGDILCMHT